MQYCKARLVKFCVCLCYALHVFQDSSGEMCMIRSVLAQLLAMNNKRNESKGIQN